MNKLKLVTVWLGGCSGCHMSFLDLLEMLLAGVSHPSGKLIQFD